MIFFGVFLFVLIIYTLLVFSVKAAKILENIFTDSIDKTRIKEAAQANLFCASYGSRAKLYINTANEPIS